MTTNFLLAAQAATNFGDRYRLIVAACEAQPDTMPPWYALGCLLMDAHRYPAAAAAFARADHFAPGDFRILQNWGTALYYCDRYEEARSVLLSASQAEPTAGQPWCMLAQIVGHFVDGAPAIAYARDAVRLSAGAPFAHMALKNVLWLEGQWAEGFREYEWRFAYRIPEPLSYPFPLWRGERVGTLFVQSEQGLGDTIWGLRWGPLIEDRAERVVFYAHREIVPLLESGLVEKWWTELRPMPQPLPAADAWIGLLSLPVACDYYDFDRQPPYIGPPKAAAQSNPVTEGQPKRVGIVWAGADDADDADLKNIPFTDMLRLAAIPGVELHSLQVGTHAADFAAFAGYGLVSDRSPEIHNLLDTANIIAGLDLVIAADTAVAHLAGAMGKPVWLLLNQRRGDGRWRRTGSATLWYPGVRVWRRSLKEQWIDVIERVVVELAR